MMPYELHGEVSDGLHHAAGATAQGRSYTQRAKARKQVQALNGADRWFPTSLPGIGILFVANSPCHSVYPINWFLAPVHPVR
jgi:hypothetical protein